MTITRGNLRSRFLLLNFFWPRKPEVWWAMSITKAMILIAHHKWAYFSCFIIDHHKNWYFLWWSMMILVLPPPWESASQFGAGLGSRERWQRWDALMPRLPLRDVWRKSCRTLKSDTPVRSSQTTQPEAPVTSQSHSVEGCFGLINSVRTSRSDISCTHRRFEHKDAYETTLQNILRHGSQKNCPPSFVPPQPLRKYCRHAQPLRLPKSTLLLKGKWKGWGEDINQTALFAVITCRKLIHQLVISLDRSNWN